MAFDKHTLLDLTNQSEKDISLPYYKNKLNKKIIIINIS